MDDESRKQIERAEYRTKLIQAELNAVKSSRAYQLSKKAGIIKAQIFSDPVGLSKKAAKILLKNPSKARHLLRSANRGAFLVQSVAEQAVKYQEWILLNEPDEGELDVQRKLADKLKYRPLISVVTPVFNPPLQVFEDLIESMLEQTYTNFELCLGNFGDEPAVDDMIARYAKLDKRIKHYKFDDNRGIAWNSNLILEKVTGEFIALLDHDDTLSPDALYENAKLLNEKDYDFIYSDKDKIDEIGNRFDPLFKPSPSPEMLLNVNYLTHLNVMRTSLVRDIGGWDPDTDGAQDWDLFLRVVAESKHVGFIPKVLYHWRVIATSTAMSIDTKPYALANQCKAVNKYLTKNNIPAHGFLERTELILKWDEQSLDQAPLVFLYYTNTTNSHRMMIRTKRIAGDATFVLLAEDMSKAQAADVAAKMGVDVVVYEKSGQANAVAEYLASHKKLKAKNALFMLDSIRLPKGDDWYERLTGWLAIPDVAAASGRLVNRHDLIVSSGGIITPDFNYFPLFHNYPRYYQSYIGNAEWLRNLSVIAPVYCATKLDLLRKYCASSQKNKPDDWSHYFLSLTEKHRIVLSPHATASVFENSEIDVERSVNMPGYINTTKPYVDPFSNPNMSRQDPLRLFADEPLVGIDDTQAGSSVPLSEYQHDAVILANTFDISQAEIDANRKIVSNKQALQPTSAAWFLPSFEKAYAGLMSIFGLANYMAEEQGLNITFYIITGTDDVTKERAETVAKFPGLSKARFVPMRPDQLDTVKPHDIGIATQWATAYPLAKLNVFKRKAYFIQDNEPNFYPAGTVSALAELSYRFGFYGIASTKGLLEMYQGHGGRGTILPSRVDLSAFQPPAKLRYETKGVYKVFFYARPNMPRNAFELGIAGLKKLKLDMGDKVEILLAGAAWDSKAYDAAGLFTNRGLMPLETVPKFYQSMDAGLMFMFSGHPGVTASELMASGCPVVVNEYDDKTWNELYQHEKTCLVSLPTASEVARNLKRCLQEKELRKQLIDGGLKKTLTFYADYNDSLRDAYKNLIKG